MPKRLQDIEKDALQLSTHDRALLVEHLLATLDQEEEEDIEEAWLQEAEKRYQAYRAGKMKARSAEQVFNDAAKKSK